MKIGFDFDGVIADSHATKPEIAKTLFNVSFSLGLSKDEIVGTYLTLEQYEQVKKVLYYGHFKIQPMQYVIYYMRLMMNEGHNIKIITSRSAGTLITALKLLNDWGLGGVEVVGVGRGKSKKEASTGLNLYIDDDVDKLTPLSETVPHLLLFTQPDNKQQILPRNIYRVDSWHEIYNYIRYEYEI